MRLIRLSKQGGGSRGLCCTAECRLTEVGRASGLTVLLVILQAQLLRGSINETVSNKSEQKASPATYKTAYGLQDTHLERITTVLRHADNTLIVQSCVWVSGIFLAEDTISWIRSSSCHRRNTIIGPGIGICYKGNSRLERQITGKSL